MQWSYCSFALSHWNILKKFNNHIAGLAQDCSNSISNALELLQSCTKSLNYLPNPCHFSFPNGQYVTVLFAGWSLSATSPRRTQRQQWRAYRMSSPSLFRPPDQKTTPTPNTRSSSSRHRPMEWPAVSVCCYWYHPSVCIVFLTLSVRGLSYLGLIKSIPWLLMPWLLASLGDQQPWYWQLCEIGMSLSYTRKDSNYLCHFSAEE